MAGVRGDVSGVAAVGRGEVGARLTGGLSAFAAAEATLAAKGLSLTAMLGLKGTF